MGCLSVYLLSLPVYSSTAWVSRGVLDGLHRTTGCVVVLDLCLLNRLVSYLIGSNCRGFHWMRAWRALSEVVMYEPRHIERVQEEGALIVLSLLP